MNDTETLIGFGNPAITEAEIKRAMGHLKYWCKGQVSRAGLHVAVLLDRWDGLHHFDQRQMRKVDWTSFYVEVRLDRSLNLSTFDFNGLTRLVFLAHDLCVRVDVAPCNPRFLKLIFHPRRAREGNSSERHPTIEDALLKWRECGFALDEKKGAA